MELCILMKIKSIKSIEICSIERWVEILFLVEEVCCCMIFNLKIIYLNDIEKNEKMNIDFVRGFSV